MSKIARIQTTNGITPVSCILASVALAAATLAGCSDSHTATAPDPIDLSSTAPPRVSYEVTDLGTLGGSFSFSIGINSAGHVGGGANTASQVQHFFLWRDGHMIDAGSLGGNANAAGPNASDELAGSSETPVPDQNDEDVCGYGTHQQCLAAVWRGGVLTALPNLSGNNAAGLDVNDRGEVVGLAETTVEDPTCATGTPFQRYRYLPVIWESEGQIRSLPLLAGDQVGFAFALNNRDQIVGSSGSCATTTIAGRIIGPHAVLWNHGVAESLDPPGAGATLSMAASINDRGDIVGASGGASVHGWLWTRAAGRKDLGALPGDQGSFAAWINNSGQIVGSSCPNDPQCNTFNPTTQSRAYIWQNGTMTDLNTLVSGNPHLYLLMGCAINDNGQITGLALNTDTFEAHAYLATPVHQTSSSRKPVDIAYTVRHFGEL